MSLNILIKEVRFMVKRAFPHIPMIIAVSLMLIAPLYINLRGNVSEVLTPEAKSIIINNTIETYTSLSIVTTSSMYLYLVGSLVREDREDKVFEHLFSSPIPPLKIILYRFAASIPFLILCCAIMSLLNFLAILIAVSDFLSITYFSIALFFILSVILGLPLCYIMIFNGLIIPQKYFIAMILIFQLPIFSTGGLAILLSATQSTPFEAFRLATIIVSVIITIISLLETVFMKDRVVEMIITA